MEVIIRHYLPVDQGTVFEIAADTAFFGAPVEAFLEDRRLFTDAFARYYTEHESTFAWVAEGPLGVIGFLFGCADTSLQTRKWRAYILKNVLVNAISNRYRLGRKTAGFASGMVIGMLRGEDLHVNLGKFPAHLQIDVRLGYRGDGVGKRLIDAYLDQLRELKIGGVHLETTSHNEAACHLYEKIGFQLQDERVNRFWTKMLGFEVKNRTYAMQLG